MTTEKNQQVATVQPPSRSLNPFDAERKLPAGGNASSNAETQRAIAEVQAAIVLAKQFPRDKVIATDRILNECTRETLAEAATYSYTKGGQEVSGPSIRLAEVLAANWGNFTYGWKEVARREVNGVGVSEIIAFAWDYETNVRTTREFNVRHYRDTKKGGYHIKDERDIYELCANQAARRMRSCVLNIIPGDVVEAAERQCELTLTSKEIITPEKIAALVGAFEKLGVSKVQIEKRIGRKLDSDSLKGSGAVMMSLRKIYNGIKEGMSSPDEFFEPELPAEAPAPVAAAQDGAPYNAATGELSDWDLVVDELIAGLAGAKDAKALADYMEEIDEQIKLVSQKGGAAACKKWAQAYAKRVSELTPAKK